MLLLKGVRMSAAMQLRDLGIDTSKQAILYLRKDCTMCGLEGFELATRTRVTLDSKSLIATIHTVSEELLGKDEASLSLYAWKKLGAYEGAQIVVEHAEPLESFQYVHQKINGHTLLAYEVRDIISDITAGNYSDVEIAAFIVACAGGRMSPDEIFFLTDAMVQAGSQLQWPDKIVVDKHSIGGIPGNRTTPIVVSIVSAFGLTMPKTSSRSITSPAGTADTMEVLTDVTLDLAQMKAVVEQEQGCFVWADSLGLSPADDRIIEIEKALNLDATGQLIASILSKKIAAGSTHVLIDVPIGPQAKIKSLDEAEKLRDYFSTIAARFGVALRVHFSDGSQPIGHGIGPALEARDIIYVLTNDPKAPEDLKERALILAGKILEWASLSPGTGYTRAQELLKSGAAWHKFNAICQAQGGLKTIPQAPHSWEYHAKSTGIITAIDIQGIATVAKLAGAPADHVAGIDMHVAIGSKVTKGQLVCTLYATSEGELHHAAKYLIAHNNIIHIEES